MAVLDSSVGCPLAYEWLEHVGHFRPGLLGYCTYKHLLEFLFWPLAFWSHDILHPPCIFYNVLCHIDMWLRSQLDLDMFLIPKVR